MTQQRVTMRHMYDALGGANLNASWWALRPLIERYAKQVADESRSDEFVRLGLIIENLRKLLDDRLAEISELKSKLDVSISPMFKSGDLVLHKGFGDEHFVTKVGVSYELSGLGEIRCREDYLTAVEKECEHIQAREDDNVLFRKIPNKFCPECGKILTKVDA